MCINLVLFYYMSISAIILLASKLTDWSLKRPMILLLLFGLKASDVYKMFTVELGFESGSLDCANVLLLSSVFWISSISRNSLDSLTFLISWAIEDFRLWFRPLLLVRCYDCSPSCSIALLWEEKMPAGLMLPNGNAEDMLELLAWGVEAFFKASYLATDIELNCILRPISSRYCGVPASLKVLLIASSSTWFFGERDWFKWTRSLL